MSESLVTADTEGQQEQTPDQTQEQVINTNTENKSEESGTPEKWFLHEGIEGAGDKPEWFNNKTFNTVADQAKAQTELRKKLGGFTGAPEKYELDLTGYEDVPFTADDPHIKKFMEISKEHNVSQELFTKFMNTYIEVDSQQNKNASEIVENKKTAEKEKIQEGLGENKLADQEIKELCLWYKNNFGESDYNSFTKSLCTADDFFRWNTVKDKFSKHRVPSSSHQVSNHTCTHEECNKARSDPRYKTDPVYQKQVQKMYASMLGYDPDIIK